MRYIQSTMAPYTALELPNFAPHPPTYPTYLQDQEILEVDHRTCLE